MIEVSDELPEETSIDVSSALDDSASIGMVTLLKLLVFVVVLEVSLGVFQPSPFIKS